MTSMPAGPGDGIIVCDPGGRVVWVNDACERVFERTREQLIGHDLSVCLGETARVGVGRLFAEASHDLEGAVGYVEVRPNGTSLRMQWIVRALFGADRHVAALLSVVTEIPSSRSRIVPQLDSSRSTRLETLGALACGVAHDLNNILTTIFGYAQIAIVSGQNAESAQAYAQILKAGGRGRELVKRILSFSGEEDGQFRTIDIAVVIADTVAFLEAALPSTIEISTSVPPRSVCVRADPDQLCQVLLNLATNAAQAMKDRGRIRLAVTTLQLENFYPTDSGSVPPGRYIVVAVEDNGPGIPSAILPRIFEPFFTTKKAGEGTGLGLSVVREIVTKHAGGIEVGSPPGGGARFRIYLPSAGEDVLSTAVGESSGPPKTGRGEKIAVIDDEPQVAMLTGATLRRAEYAAAEFSSAVNFLQNVGVRAFDVIVTDQTMPGMTGLELITRLRQDGIQLPVILLTGGSREVQSNLIALLPHVILLRKPFTSDELLTAVRRVLGPANDEA
jgi:signal transduction histidine kinase